MERIVDNHKLVKIDNKWFNRICYCYNGRDNIITQTNETNITLTNNLFDEIIFVEDEGYTIY